MNAHSSIASIVEQLAAGVTTSSDLAREYIKTAEQKKDLNAYISLDEQNVLAQAEAADKARMRGERGALLGVPLAIKDNILIEGGRTTAASRMLDNYRAAHDATVIKKLRGAGALFLGKTNMDEFAMGSSTEHSAFGPTKNPIHPSYVPGGSSGGSAAAVAAGLCAGALGSDTAGSIRQPAAFCGIVGFKPTYGAVSRHGLIAMASSLDQIGPMTRTVEDARILFDIIRGGDRYDATSMKKQETKNKKQTHAKGLKIGVPKEYFGEGLDSRIEEKVRDAIAAYKEMGADVVDIALPHTPYALAAYYILMSSEVSANLARFDGMRYGYSLLQEDVSLHDAYTRARGEGFGREVKRRIMLGTYTLSHGYYDAYYTHAQKVRTLITKDFLDAWKKKKVDVIMAPTTPTLPFKLGEISSQDPTAMYLADVLTVSANLAGLPAISIPCGTIKEEGSDFSASLQIIGQAGADDALLDVASLFAQ